MNGFLFINKEKNYTSRDICNIISKKYHTKKVGHLGTLDPFATGLLIIALGSATKCLPFLNDDIKEYEATLFLGKKTSTGDPDGEVLEIKDVPLLDKKTVEEVFKSFLGEQEQIPPMSSAIHVDGIKLYKLAHQGLEIERKPRRIFIYDIGLISMEGNIIKYRVLCSKGTYVRTLSEDIAKKLGTIGYLQELKRTKVGIFNLVNSISISEINDSSVLPIIDVMTEVIPLYQLSDKEEIQAKNGVMLNLNSNAKTLLLVNKNKDLIAIYGLNESKHYGCLRGLWS